MNSYRIYLNHGSYYSLNAANVKKAIRSARKTARALGIYKKEFLNVERIQKFYKNGAEVDLRIST